MVDFKSLRRREPVEPKLDPIELFRALPKPEHINDLWDTQAEALRSWHERREERDLSIKLNTGSGKTLVGLIVCEASRREVGKPSLYLAPTRQLVGQVVEKAQELGIPAEPYAPGGGLPPAFENGEAVLVGSYHSLFNGRSVFGVLGQAEPVTLGAVVLDDAHTSAATLRDIFSVSVSRAEHEDLYRELVGSFRHSFEQVHAVGRFDDMMGGREEGVMEIPYWAWSVAAGAIRERIQALGPDAFRFSLPLVRDFFEFSHALVSRDALTITPLLPPVHMLPSFSNCGRRVFMSATIADDGVLVRTFGADPSSISRPITTRSVAGLGERMILSPTLSGLSPEAAMVATRALCSEASQAGRGAVVLVPSRGHAASWEDFGPVCVGDEVAEAVGRLLEPSTRRDAVPIIVNRYDGIDLPQESCRILVLDGRPRGANDYDRFRATMLQGSSSIDINLAQRVEQGMGRGTRGAGDYCVVILLGSDLVEWLGRKGAQRVLTPGTRAQVELGREMAGHISDADDLMDAARQCLGRNPEWKQVHAERIAQAGEDRGETETLVAAGRIERRAFEMLLHQRATEACDFLRRSAEDSGLDPAFRAWVLQLAARSAHLAGQLDQAEALQAEAHSLHRGVMKPRAGVQYRRLATGSDQAARIVGIIEQYGIRSSAIQALDLIFSDIHPGATPNRFEEGVRGIGSMLGFESDRPEAATHQGPDNLWIGGTGLGFVIECKHEKATPANKQDHGQLRTSVEWFDRNYEGLRRVPIIVHPDGRATSNSALVGSDARALTWADLGRLKVALKEVYTDLAFSTETPDALQGLAVALLGKKGLDAESVAEQFTRPFVEAQRE